ncbi:hypothetical protein [Alkalihalobacillus shacheensis]
MEPIVRCPSCNDEQELPGLLTALSNQNVVYTCRKCGFEERNIETDKG